MFNARLYRAALVPFVFALAIAAFSLGGRPLPLGTTLAPDAFEGARAFSELRHLTAAFPQRRPGSPGDEELARYIAAKLEGLGGTAGGGFSVHLQRFDAQTIDGERPLETVIAQRPGSTEASPIVILAHRDAAARGSEAELSGTAVLLELARVFAARETKRTIILVSTSGGSGGEAGAMRLAGEASQTGQRGPVDAAIALGDLAGTQLRRPLVVPYSASFGSAPLQLQRTLADAITHETGSDPGTPSILGQLAHFVLPITVGEQGVLDASGVPAVLVQASGERGASAHEAVSAERLEGLGRGVLSAVDALDTAPDVSPAMQTGLVLQRKILPGWTVSMLVGTLLLSPLVVLLDALARMRRRRMPVGRWVLWTLACALPFLACALFAALLGRLGIVAGAPAEAVLPSAMPFDGDAAAIVLAVALAFALSWLLWGSLMRRLRWELRPDPEVSGLAMLLVLAPVGLAVWAGDPYTALLIIPALHLWLLLADPGLRPRRGAALALFAVALLPLGLLIAFYWHQLGLGPGGVAWMAVLLLAGGHIGIGPAILWSVALGCAAVAGMLALREPALPPRPAFRDGGDITIRGPLSYAGPGSLGGTESALRR